MQPTSEKIEVEITKRWNSLEYNPHGVIARESLRAGVLKDFETKKQKVIKSLGDIPEHISSMEDQVFDAMIKCIKDNLSPEDVFDESQLEKWADKNDYVKGMSDAY